MKIAVITASDMGAAGKRQDESGPAIVEIVTRLGGELVSSLLLPDEQDMLEEAMRRIADKGLANLILTTGSTGCSKRDCMPEATRAVVEREVPGIPEAMRAYSMQFTGRAMLSRAAAGIRKETLIVNLPGSPKAVRETLEYIYPHLVHGVELLTGMTNECARTDGAQWNEAQSTERMLAVCGVKNSGKTSYLERLVKELASHRVRVAVVKHDGHEFEGDIPGTDTWRLYHGGAVATAVFSEHQLLIHKKKRSTLEEMTKEFSDCDLILVEGMKETEAPKLELVRAGLSDKPCSNPKGRLGIVTDIPDYASENGEPVYCLEDLEPVLRMIVKQYHLNV